MDVEVVLTQPAKIDGKIMMPDGNAIMVTPEVRDQLIVSGAVAGDLVTFISPYLPISSPRDLAAELDDALEQSDLLQNKLDAAEGRYEEASQLFADELKTSKALKDKVAALEAELDALNTKNTPPSEKTAKPQQKGAAAKKG